MRDAAAFLLVLALTAGLVPLLVGRAEHWGLVAQSDARRTHEGAIPVVGGIAMGLPFLAGYLWRVDPAQGMPALALAAAAAITLAGGVLDDRHELRASLKFGVQILAGVLLAGWGEALLQHLGRLMTAELFTLGRYAFVLTVFAIVGVMNAMNMADGVDGLAGGLALVGFAGFGWAAAANGDAFHFNVACLGGAAAAGFLAWNARTPWRGAARAYMGDAGSLFLGLLLAWLAIRLATGAAPALAPITAVWILALPVGDTVAIMLRRLARGRSPFRADREHLHHVLLAVGLPHGIVALVLVAAALALAAAGLAAERHGVPERVMFYSYVSGLVAWALLSELLCRRLGLRTAST